MIPREHMRWVNEHGDSWSNSGAPPIERLPCCDIWFPMINTHRTESTPPTRWLFRLGGLGRSLTKTRPKEAQEPQYRDVTLTKLVVGTAFADRIKDSKLSQNEDWGNPHLSVVFATA